MIDIHLIVHIFHIIFVGGLFLYVGINRNKNPKGIFPFLLVLGIFIIFYHLFKVYNYIKDGKSIWVNIIHILFIGPLLVYIGYHKENTARLYYELLLMFAFASIGYHGYYLINSYILQ